MCVDPPVSRMRAGIATRIRRARLSTLIVLVSACTGWNEYPVRQIPTDSVIPSLRVGLRDGTHRSLTNVTVTPDSVTGRGSATSIRVAYTRSDVVNTQRRSLEADAQVRVTRKDGSMLLLRYVQVSRDSVTGFVDGPLERVAFARTDVRQLQRHGAKPGRTLALIGGVVAGFMLYAIGTMESFSLGGTP